MKINDFFGDQQARNAAVAMANNRKQYDDWHNQIRNQSGGAVDKDWNYVSQLPAEKKARRDQVFQQKYENAGGSVSSLYESAIDFAGRAIDGAFSKQRRSEELPKELQENQARREALQLQLEELRERKASYATPPGDIEPRINAIERALRFLNADDAEKRIERRKYQGDKAVPTAEDLGTKTGTIPIPLDRPVNAALSKDMSGAAERSMSGYKDALIAAGRDAEVIVQGIADKLKNMLSFTATPTISPNMVNPGSSTAKVPGKQTSVTTNTPTKVTQNITTPSAVRAARLAQKEQDRAVRMARYRAVADMGSMPA